MFWRKKSCHTKFDCRAYTLTQLVFSVGIIALLAVISIPIYSGVRDRSYKVTTIYNLKALHSALAAYVTDKGQWPQVPDNLDVETGNYWRWWHDALRPYDFPDKSWLSPTLYEDLKGKGDEIKEHSSYIIVNFDADWKAPYRWANQPWAWEIAPEGKTAHMLMPDGSIRTAPNR